MNRAATLQPPPAPARTIAPAPQEQRQRETVTPEGIALPLTLASRGARAGALMLDLAILSTALTVFYITLIALALRFLEPALTGLQNASQGAFEFLVIVFALAGFVAWYGYFLAQELGPRGATLGKRLVGIRIAARGGGRLTPEAVIARNLLRDIEVFYPLVALLTLVVSAEGGEDSGALAWAAAAWFALFAAFPFFNRDALRAGDIVAGTWVVQRPAARLVEALSTRGAAAQSTSEVTGARYDFGAAELGVYGEKELITLERMLREGDAAALVAVHAAICRKIGWEPGAGDERAFLEAFYAQLRAKLEADMRFGKRKADKHS